MSKHVIVSDAARDEIAEIAAELRAERGRPVSFAEVVEYLLTARRDLVQIMKASYRP